MSRTYLGGLTELWRQSSARRLGYYKIGCLLLLLACASIGAAAEASAATFTVDNTSDAAGDCSIPGQCTLRSAIQASNATAGVNTISLNPGTYQLSSAGLLEIRNNTVTVTGTNSDPAQTIIKGDGAHRVFAVMPGINVTFEGITVQEGLNTPDSYGHGGGAIAAQLGAGNILTIDNSVIQNNAAQDGATAGYGGGVYVSGPSGAKLVVHNTLIGSNTAGGRGGGVYAEGDLDIQVDQATFTSNTASQELGGGLAILAGTYNNSGTITIQNTTFNSNAALGSSDDGIGGGLYLNAPATLSASTFTGNTANSDGGGIYLTVFDHTRPTTLSDVTFTSNSSDTGKGTGLFVQNGNPVLINTQFMNNMPVNAGAFAANPMPVTPTTPASPMKTSDNSNYAGGSWTNKDVTISTDASLDGGQTWNQGPVQVTDEGDHSAVMKLEDQLYNAVLLPVHVMIDKTKPVVSVAMVSGGNSYTEGSWAKGDIQVNVTDSDALSGVQTRNYSLDGGTSWTPFPQSAPITLAAEGSYTLKIQVTDAAGNTEEQSFNVKLDKTNPALSMTLLSGGAPYTSGTWVTGPVSLTAASSDAGSGLSVTQYSLNGGNTWNNYTAPVTLTADGTYDVLVRAADQAGNTAQSAATVKIDATQPVVNVAMTSGGTSYTEGSWSTQAVIVDATAGDSGSGLSSYQYSLDGGTSWTDYSSPISLTADGTYTAQFKAADAAGNMAQQSVQVKIDQAAPDLGATVQASSGSPYVSDTWSREPVILELQPSDATSGITASQYSLNNGADWTDYTGPVTVTDGVYEVQARATDAAAQVTQTGWTIKVDTVAPVLDITAVSGGQAYISGTWASQSVTFSLTGSDQGSGSGPGALLQEVSLNDGASWNVYTAPITVTEGVYSVKAIASDPAGNSTTKSFLIQVDQLAPELTVTMTAGGQPYLDGTWTSQDVSVQLAAADGSSGLAGLQYKLESDSSWTDYTGAILLTGDGMYSYDIQAVDGQGLTASQRVTVKIDKTPPTAAVNWTTEQGDPYIEGSVTNQKVTLEVTPQDNGSGTAAVTYSLDGGSTWTAYAGPVELTADGQYAAAVQVTDQVGLSVREDKTVILDRTKPVLTVTASTQGGAAYTDGAWTQETVLVQVEAADAHLDPSTIQAAIDGASWQGMTQNPDVLTVAAEGHHTVQVKAADTAGNLVTGELTVNISRTAPSVQLNATPASVTHGNVQVSVTASVYGLTDGNTVAVVKTAAGDQQEAFFRAGGGQALPLNALSFEAADNGVYSVYVQDAAGNETVEKVQIDYIVRQVPGLQLNFSPSGLTNGKVTVTVTTTVYGEDKGNAITQQKWAEGDRDTAYFASSGHDLGAGSTVQYEVSSNGVYTVYAKDAAGNEAVGTIDIQTISLTKPTLTLQAAPVEPTHEQVAVSVTAAVYGSPNGIATIRWAPGTQDVSFFEGGGGTALGTGSPASFTVTENGDYSVYVKDLAGNAETQVIHVTEVNHAPVVTGAHTVYGTENTVLTFAAADFPFSDADGDPLVQVQVTGLPAHGELLWNGSPVTVGQAVYAAGLSDLTFEPDMDWAGMTSFTWTGFDGLAYAPADGTMTISIGAGNRPPSAGAVELTTSYNTTLQGQLIGQDPEGDPLTYTLEAQGQLGTFSLLNAASGTFEYKPQPDAAGTDTVTYTVYDSHQAYGVGSVKVTILPRSASDQAGLTSLSLSAGPLTPAFNSGVFGYTMSVTNAVYALTVTAAVYDSHATLLINDIVTASGQASEPITLHEGWNTIVVKVEAEDGIAVNTYTIAVYRQPHKSSHSNSSNASGGAEQPEPKPGVTGEWNGKPTDGLGTVVTEQVGGQKVTTAAIDADKLKDLMERSEGKPVLAVSVNGDEDRVILNMNPQVVSMLQASEGTLQVETGLGSYELPFAALPLDLLAASFGPQANAVDISLKISISKASAEVIKQAQEQAREGQYAILASPVDFTVTAVYKDRESEIHVFSGLVSRQLPIPADVPAAQITTAVVVLPDGTVYHVPTRIGTESGKPFVSISSLTNSTYAVISNVKSFDDMNGHWAQLEVNQMASRMIVQGVAEGEYNPDAPVTRAQFAAIVIRALGLSDKGQPTADYSDVHPTDWYAGAIAQARRFGLVSGYEDGTFRPEQTITREEALVMIARAAKLAGHVMDLHTADPKTILSNFKDEGEIGNWALQEAALAVQSGLIQGSGDGLKPKSELTRAETAVILYRLLVKTNLING